MKTRVLIIALSVALVVMAAPVHAASPQAQEHPTWIVTLASGSPAAEHATSLVAPLGGTVQHVFRHVLNGFSFHGSERAAQALERNPKVLRVEPDRAVRMTGESASNGFFRIDADATYAAGDRGTQANGTPVRIAILDTGIMVNHSDLAPNLDLTASYNCISPGQSVNDDQGHGTHVAGSAAAADQGEGMVGVASQATLVGVKVLDSAGYGSDAQVICGLDHVAGLVASDGVPTVVNLSLGEAHALEGAECASSGIHQAICNLTDGGVTVVAAAGNSAADAANFYPAAYSETIAVSAFSALNGTPGNDGCQFFLDVGYQCDDELASFTNYGSVIDVTAPGVRVQSTTFDGGWGLNSGSSMAAPFAAGVAALILAEKPTATLDEVRTIMQSTGECPDGSTAAAPTCTGHGQWLMTDGLFGTFTDPDGIPEPLIDAAAAVAAATTTEPDTTPPTVALTSPVDGATYEAGIDVVTADYTCLDDESGISSCNGDEPSGTVLDTSTPGVGYTFTVVATDNATNTTTVTHTYDIVDTTAPIITLIGDDPMIHVAGELFTDPGADVSDNVDPSITIVGDSDVDESTPGTYSITYDYTDGAGIPAVTVIREVTVVDGTAPTTEFAAFEATLYGTLTNTYTATHAADGTAEVITEVQSGGRPSNRTSRLDHTWTIPFSGGDGTVYLLAEAPVNAEGDVFDFDYSLNGVGWTYMMTVTGTPGVQSFALPAGLPAGDLMIRVTDSDRTTANVELDWVSVDHLYVESRQNGIGPAFLLEATVTKVVGAPAVILTWTDIGVGTYTVFRDATEWALGISSTSYVDQFAKKETGSYVYSVCVSDLSLCSNEVTVKF